jgi:lysozyme
MNALQLAYDHCAAFEAFRSFPYPDPASPLAEAAPKCRWGLEPATGILADLPLGVRLLSGDPWTIGYGQTGKTIGPNTPPWSQAVGRANLEARLESHIETIDKRAMRQLREGQMAALAGFLDNVGPGAEGRKDGLFVLKSGGPSTLWHCVVEGMDARAANEFLKWARAGGQVLPGLLRRRQAERALYLQAA